MVDLMPTGTSTDVPAVVYALKTLFCGRNDDFVRQTSASKGKRMYRALRDDDYKAHLRGVYSIGPYILSPDMDGGKGCRFGCVDIDRSDAAALEGARSAVAILQHLGLTPVPELSKSARWHVWVFFDEAVQAASVRRVLGHVARTALKDHELYKLSKDNPSEFAIDKKSGKKISVVEVFPKHDALEGRVKWSNAVQLPLNGARLREGRSALVDQTTWEPYTDQYAALLAIRPDSPTALADAVEMAPAPPKPERLKHKRKPRQRPPGSSDPWADIRAAIDIVEYVELCTGQTGRRSGPETAFLCPFHEEREPSFMVNADKGVFHCHGCEATGDVFHFHERFHNVDKATALTQLADLAGVEIGGEQDGIENLKPRSGRNGERNTGQGHARVRTQARGVHDSGSATSDDGRHDDAFRGRTNDGAGNKLAGADFDRGKSREVDQGSKREVTGHPNAPRVPTKELIMEYMTAPGGPEFEFKHESKLYSKRDRTWYTARQWRDNPSREVYHLLLARSEDVSEADATAATMYQRHTAARRAWNMWAISAFMELVKILPEKGETDGTTASEDAEFAAAVRAALTKELMIAEGAGDYVVIRSSVFEHALNQARPTWSQIGHFGAYCKAGPRIAIRYDFLIAHGGVQIKKYSQSTLARRLNKHNIATSKVEIASTRVYVINDNWLADNFELKIEKETEAPPAPAERDVKKLAAGDMDDKDAPPF